MKRRRVGDPQGRAGLTLAALLCAWAFNTPHAAREETLPYGLVVSVAYGPTRGPESLRDDLERDLTIVLAQSRCFESVERAGAGVERGLRLRVTLDEYEESVEYSTGLADRAPSQDTDAQYQMVARVSASVDLSVWLEEQPNLVRHRRFAQRSGQSGPGAAEQARLALTDEILRTTRSFMCKGSAAKWERELARVRAAVP